MNGSSICARAATRYEIGRVPSQYGALAVESIPVRRSTSGSCVRHHDAELDECRRADHHPSRRRRTRPGHRRRAGPIRFIRADRRARSFASGVLRPFGELSVRFRHRSTGASRSCSAACLAWRAAVGSCSIAAVTIAPLASSSSRSPRSAGRPASRASSTEQCAKRSLLFRDRLEHAVRPGRGLAVGVDERTPPEVGLHEPVVQEVEDTEDPRLGGRQRRDVRAQCVAEGEVPLVQCRRGDASPWRGTAGSSRFSDTPEASRICAMPTAADAVLVEQPVSGLDDLCPSRFVVQSISPLAGELMILYSPYE